MSFKSLQLAIGLSLGMGLAACAAAEQGAAATDSPDRAASPGAPQSYAGWYMEHAGQGTFQPCGQDRAWRVSASADLPARAKRFGLDEGNPVYARITGIVQGNAISVSRVDQFGSPTPVRNCGLTGVVLPPES